MTRTATIVIFVLIVLAVASGAYYWTNQDSSSRGTEEAAPLGSEVGLESATTLPTGSSTSDVSLDTALSAIDAQLGALSSDSAAVGTSLTDTSVEQSTL